MDMQVELAVAGRAVTPRQRPEWCRAGAVQRALVSVDPISDLAQDARGGFRDAAETVRTDVEQVSPTPTDHLGQPPGQLPRALEVLVVPGVAPGVVVGVAGLPQAGAGEGGDLLIAERVVVSETVADAAVDQTVGLQLVDQVDQHLRLRRRDRPRRVEPDAGDLAVVGEQFLELWDGLAV